MKHVQILVLLLLLMFNARPSLAQVSDCEQQLLDQIAASGIEFAVTDINQNGLIDVMDVAIFLTNMCGAPPDLSIQGPSDPTTGSNLLAAQPNQVHINKLLGAAFGGNSI